MKRLGRSVLKITSVSFLSLLILNACNNNRGEKGTEAEIGVSAPAEDTVRIEVVSPG
jgi:hypothetical protein